MGQPEHIRTVIYRVLLGLMKPSVICRAVHVQNCFECDDLTCGDNTSDLKRQLDALEAEVGRLKGNNGALLESNKGHDAGRRAAERALAEAKKEIKKLKKGAPK